MAAVNISFGVFYILMAFVVHANPNLIAGYNGLSKEQKSRIDEKGLARFIKNVMVAMGIGIVVGHVLTSSLENSMLVEWVIIIVTIAGVIVMVAGTNRYMSSD